MWKYCQKVNYSLVTILRRWTKISKNEKQKSADWVLKGINRPILLDKPKEQEVRNNPTLLDKPSKQEAKPKNKPKN